MKLIIICLSLLFCLQSTFAIAQTHKIESENFILTGDISVNDGKLLVGELERFRAVLFQVFDKRYRSEKTKLSILTLSDEAEFGEITGASGASGVYYSRLEGAIFVLWSGEGENRQNRARQIAYHEYTHHFLNTYTKVFYPKWYNEGIAEYYSNFEKNQDDEFVFGNAVSTHIERLNSFSWLAMITVLESHEDYPFRDWSSAGKIFSSVNFFYAQSWLAANYFKSSPVYEEKLNKFLLNLTPIDNKQEKFKRIFGMSVIEFGDVLREYAKGSQFVVNKVKPHKNWTQKQMTIARITEGQRAFYIAEAAKLILLQSDTIDQVSAYYDHAVALGIRNIDVEIARAELANANKDFEAAKKIIQIILNKHPLHERSNFVAAKILIDASVDEQIRRGQIDDNGDLIHYDFRGTMQQAQTYLQRVINKDQSAFHAHYYYALAALIKGDEPNEQSVRSSVVCAQHYVSKEFAPRILLLAPILIYNEKYYDLRKIANLAMGFKDAKIRRFARNVLADIKKAERNSGK